MKTEKGWVIVTIDSEYISSWTFSALRRDAVKSFTQYFGEWEKCRKFYAARKAIQTIQII